MRTVPVALVGWLLLNPAALALGDNIRDRSTRVDALLECWSKGKSPGAAVLVVSHGKVVHRKGYGFADLDTRVKIADDTNFRLASVSKQFTAMAIMILAERGKLGYDDPLAKFFPEFPAYARTITVRHLLHHTAGLLEYERLFEREKKISCDWPRSSRSEPDPFEPTSRDARELLARQEELKFPVGDAYKYSNSGYVVLGQIVEKVSGKSYAEFLAEEIFTPLEMKKTIVSDGKTPAVAKLARSYDSAYSPGKGQVVYHEIDYTPLNRINGDDGVYSSIDDLRKWAEALDRPVLVSRKTLGRAFRGGKLNNGDPIDYGFGWVIERKFGKKCIWHNGGWAGFETYIARYPRRGLTVIVLANCAQLDATEMGEQIAKIYLNK